MRSRLPADRRQPCRCRWFGCPVEGDEKDLAQDSRRDPFYTVHVESGEWRNSDGLFDVVYPGSFRDVGCKMQNIAASCTRESWTKRFRAPDHHIEPWRLCYPAATSSDSKISKISSQENNTGDNLRTSADAKNVKLREHSGSNVLPELEAEWYTRPQAAAVTVCDQNTFYFGSFLTSGCSVKMEEFATLNGISIQTASTKPSFQSSNDLSFSTEESAPVASSNGSPSGVAWASKEGEAGERITALQQLVSPFGKTDTASVLLEAIGYIKFLQDQVQVLSTPYVKGFPSGQTQEGSVWDSGISLLRRRGLA